ncbi:glycosyltransferase family 2 protein [Halosimplex salinum]|uniref:glycosyltransferase family 2 protein n=1 Tax=Halosimplex salinum TaxID=1710538 RepID=UPI000F4AED2C|nr:glycosyltransferase [Halosimplex salinum]
MQLSVVVPTLDGREQLARTLDALAEHVPAAEVVVVNGPSTDGTTGMVRERDDVDVLVEVADRTVTAARNAGIDQATGDVVAIVDQGLSVTEEWFDALAAGLAEADVVSGPVHEQLRGGMTTEEVESDALAGREVTYFNGGNVAFSRPALDALDGFDEYLEVGSARDGAHRLATMDFSVTWAAGMGVAREVGADGGGPETDQGWKYRSLAYRLVKNYGVGPRVAARLVAYAGRDALDSLRDVARGDATPSGWLGTGRDVLSGLAVGSKDGVWARLLDRSSRRNPYGRSARSDRAVAVYDRR